MKQKLRKIVSKLKKKPDAVFLHFTGNVFGLGCSAFNEKAIERISKLKKRRKQKKGFIVLIPDKSWLQKFHIKYDGKFEPLLQQYWPGNLTAIFKDEQGVFPHLSPNGTIAFRVPTSQFLRDFIIEFDEPIISTSINISGESPLVDLAAIRNEKKGWFDYEILPPELEKSQSQVSTIIDVTGNEIKLLREGSIKFEDIELSYQKPQILFVCTGNICRSPMAEYLLKEKIKEYNLNFRVKSAGFLDSGVRISTNSYQVLKDYGIDALHHVSSAIDEKLIQNSWLILTMEEKHKDELLKIAPNAGGRVFTLSEYCGREFCVPNCNIEDPFNLEIYFYRETFKKIKERIEVLAEKLLEMERKSSVLKK